MNALVQPIIDKQVDHWINLFLDQLQVEIERAAGGPSMAGGPIGLRELINKERYSVKVHIKERPVQTNATTLSPSTSSTPSTPSTSSTPSTTAKTVKEESSAGFPVRGRKKNNVVKLSDIDLNKYVQAVVILVNEDKYLLDQNNILYKYNGQNEIVGHVVEQEIQWF